MNKLVVRTSFVWVAILAVVLAIVSYLSTHKPQPRASQEPEFLASGPEPQAIGAAPQTMQPRQPPDAPLAPIQLSSDQTRAIGIQTATAEYKQLSDDIRATGTVAVDERLLSYVQVRFSGYIRKVFADATYEYIRKGQPLFTIYSPDLVATQQEYLLAGQYDRSLSHSSVEGVAEGAAALAGAAAQRLKQWDMPSAELAKIQETGTPITDLTINSQVTGYITERNAVPNLYVEPSTRLYAVADLSRVWVNAQVFQNDVGRIRPGDAASITVDAYPRQSLHARVEQILPQVDMATRTVQVRLAVQNPGTRLKPGMFVNVNLKSAAGEQLTIPASAVFQTGTRQLVFLDDGNGTFTPKDVVLGTASGSDVVVLGGLAPHQRIVTSANFLLDSESQLQAAASAPSSSGTAQNASNGVPQSNANIEFTTDPNPPHKGANTFRVKLTGVDGKPLDGAQVSVTFFMPSMPAMGMAAMKTTSVLAPKGSGLYEGRGELGSGGSWQVAITAQQNGRTLAVKQLRVDAQGGM
jgi:Cu(I)/Ag(I) efflux system membrane fusion protein/cobalt-zinc-cadmium efflux system membrane fusion protein